MAINPQLNPVRHAMSHVDALALLGLKPTYDVGTIKAAFAYRCKECHPDTGVAGSTTMEQLQQARDALLENAAALNRACKLCRGVGKIRSTMGWRECSACAGTGDRR